jgi:hypothetical protein
LEGLPRDPQVRRIVKDLEPYAKRFKEDFTGPLATLSERLCEPIDELSANTVPESTTITSLSPARARGGDETGWEEIWNEFCAWPGFDQQEDEPHARRAWANLRDRPSPEAMRECVRRYGLQLAHDNSQRSAAAGPVLVKRPVNWLERDRCWEGFMPLGAVA